MTERIVIRLPDGRPTEALSDRFVVRKCPTYDQSWIVLCPNGSVHSSQWNSTDAIHVADVVARRL